MMHDSPLSKVTQKITLFVEGSLSLASSTQQNNSLAYAFLPSCMPAAIIIECDSSSVIGKLFLGGDSRADRGLVGK